MPFRVHTLVGSIVGLAAVALAVWTWSTLRRDHDEVLAWFSDERTSQLVDAADQVAEDLGDIREHLEFAARTVEQAKTADEQRHVLGALVRSVRAYRVAAVYDVNCARSLTIVDPYWDQDPDPLFRTLDATAAAACGQPTPKIETSLGNGAGDAAWYRTFARGFDADTTAHGGALALVVDTRPILERFRTVSADSAAELLVLGPHGMPTPASSPRVAGFVDTDVSVALDGAVTAMRAGSNGRVVIPADQAVALGFPEADVVMVYTPIRMDDAGTHWSAAALVSTVALRSHERLVVGRLVVASTALGLLLLSFAGYVAYVARRDAVLAERLRGADEVAHLRERAERILDHVPSGVIAFGAKGAATALNQALRRRVPEARPGTVLADVLPSANPVALRSLQDLVRRALASGLPQSLLNERLAIFGAEGHYSVHAIPIEPPSADVAVLLVLDDLTDVRLLQDQLLRVEKLATVGILAAGIAHEVGTPLGIIRGRAEYAAGKLGPEHAQAAGLRVIVEQIDRIVRTIRALLDFSMPKLVASARTDVRGPIAKVVELLRYEAERKKLNVVVNVDDAVPEVIGDADQIEQVLVNLVLNAIDATADGGQITVVAGPDPRDGKSVRIRVANTGHGIPAENLHSVFDPFFTTKKRGHGTGLGLVIVDQIVRDHGGRLAIDSEPGRGTVVDVFIPGAADARA